MNKSGYTIKQNAITTLTIEKNRGIMAGVCSSTQPIGMVPGGNWLMIISVVGRLFVVEFGSSQVPSEFAIIRSRTFCALS